MDVSHVHRVPNGPLGLLKGKAAALPFQAFPPAMSPARRAKGIGAPPRAAWGYAVAPHAANYRRLLPLRHCRDFSSCDLNGGYSRPCDPRQAPRLCDENRGPSSPREPDQGLDPLTMREAPEPAC